MNFQMFKLVLGKAEEPEIKLPTTAGSLVLHAGCSLVAVHGLLIEVDFSVVEREL